MQNSSGMVMCQYQLIVLYSLTGTVPRFKKKDTKEMLWTKYLEEADPDKRLRHRKSYRMQYRA